MYMYMYMLRLRSAASSSETEKNMSGRDLARGTRRWAARGSDDSSSLTPHMLWPNSHGTLMRDPSKEAHQEALAEGKTDRGESGTFTAHGDYKFGRGLRDGVLSPSMTGPMDKRRGRSASPSRGSRPWSHSPRYVDPDRPVYHRPWIPDEHYGYAEELEPPYQQYHYAMPWPHRPYYASATPATGVSAAASARGGAEIEVLIGWPRWMPEGASAVYMTVECDDGSFVTSERMHAGSSPSRAGRDGLGGALVVPCHHATRVTLHVMAEYGGGRYGQPHLRGVSLGGTTVSLPEPPLHPYRGRPPTRRMELLAPLDITVRSRPARPSKAGVGRMHLRPTSRCGSVALWLWSPSRSLALSS